MILVLILCLGLSWGLTNDEFMQTANFLVNELGRRASSVDVTSNGRRPGDTPAGWLRLAFHDSGTWDPRNPVPAMRGGSHACMIIPCAANSESCEREATDNRGLKEVVDDLESIYQSTSLGFGPISKLMSRADFWQLSAKIAVEFSSGFQVTLPFFWGRTDCATLFPNSLPRFANRLPHPTDTVAQLETTFFRMGYTSWTQIIALIGAHSIGRAETKNLGYHGKWVHGDGDQFGNIYYQTLLGPASNPEQWLLQTVPGGHPEYLTPAEIGQTITDTTVFMLPSDIQMFWVADGVNCNVTLTTGSCPINRNNEATVELFATNQDAFFDEFTKAFGMMQNMGGDDLKQIFPLSAANETPAPTPAPSATPAPSTPSPAPSTPSPAPSTPSPSPSPAPSTPAPSTPAPSTPSPSPSPSKPSPSPAPSTPTPSPTPSKPTPSPVPSSPSPVPSQPTPPSPPVPSPSPVPSKPTPPSPPVPSSPSPVPSKPTPPSPPSPSPVPSKPSPPSPVPSPTPSKPSPPVPSKPTPPSPSPIPSKPTGPPSPPSKPTPPSPSPIPSKPTGPPSPPSKPTPPSPPSPSPAPVGYDPEYAYPPFAPEPESYSPSYNQPAPTYDPKNFPTSGQRLRPAKMATRV